MIQMQNPMVDEAIASEATAITVQRTKSSSNNIVRRVSDTRILGHSDLNLALKVEKRLSENKIIGYVLLLNAADLSEPPIVYSTQVMNLRVSLLVMAPNKSQQPWAFLTRANSRRMRTIFPSNILTESPKLKLKDSCSFTAEMSYLRRRSPNGECRNDPNRSHSRTA